MSYQIIFIILEGQSYFELYRSRCPTS